MMQKKTCSF